MSTFQVGDVVRLKSGGPGMTVEEIGDYSQSKPSGPRNGVLCAWILGRTFHRHIFDAAMLWKI